MKKRPAILVVAPSPTLAFVAQDLQILGQAYRIDVLARCEHRSLREFVAGLLRRLRAERYALVYVWFAEPYDSPVVVLAARAFGVKCAIVVGGYDVASLPALGYGALGTRAGRWRVRFALRSADMLFPTSDLLAAEVRQLGRARAMQVIYPGVDCTRFNLAGTRERLVVTVGTVGRETCQLKGLDVFARCSRRLPDVSFAVIGPCANDDMAEELRRLGGANLFLTERFVSASELASWFSRATVYAQLSMRESFGLALAEAMSAGCVPVAAATGFMPEVVGDAGFLGPYGDAEVAAESIACALGSDGAARLRARARVENRFSLPRREKELLTSVAQLVDEPHADAA